MNFKLHVGSIFEIVINWFTIHLGGFFDVISTMVKSILNGFTSTLLFIPCPILIIVFSIIAWMLVKPWMGIFTLVGFSLIFCMGLWDATMETLGLIITSMVISLVLGIPLGIWSSKSDSVECIVRPMLDFMQTLPAFVYLIPAVLFFRLGPVPGVIATLIFSLPPAVRLTNLGIRQVPKELKEATISFGATSRQILLKTELPIALPTILAGVNQTIMLALSMVVIAGMIGAGGLGNQVLKGITQLKIDLGFESGISIVILAIYLDRVTQALGSSTQKIVVNQLISLHDLGALEENMKKTIIITSFVIVFTVFAVISCTQKNNTNKTAHLVYANWEEGIAYTHLAKAVLEDKMNYSVTLIAADVAPAYATISQGDKDAFMETWLPTLHADYVEKYKDDIINLGIVFEDTKSGLIIPHYMVDAGIKTISDLLKPEAQKKLDLKIIGVDAGAGIMSTAEDGVFPAYGLDEAGYKLVPSSGPAMIAALKQAIDSNKWIVVTGWKPHSMFGRWDLRFLEQDKKRIWESGNIYIMGRKDLEQDKPELAQFLKNMNLTNEELGSLIAYIAESNIETFEAARQWMHEHEPVIADWIPKNERNDLENK